MSDFQLLAYFLPQFHECPFNNEWWGKGFTEWNNVRAATPLFKGHYQPRVPAEGEFSLDDPDTIAAQFAQAKAHGIDGFAIYHYWYEGQRPLGRPLDLIRAAPELPIRYSICWANHSWTRTWRNRRGALDTLIEQTYGATKTAREAHYAYLTQSFADPRYTHVGGKPLFQIYIPEDIPSLDRYCDELREFSQAQLGKTPHLSATIRRWTRDFSYLEAFDSATLAQPTLGLFSGQDVFGAADNNDSAKSWLRARLLDLPLPMKKILYTAQDMLPKRPTKFDYATVWDNVITQSEHAIQSSPCPVNLSGFVEFDNTPRYRKAAKIIDGFSPDVFQSGMQRLAELSQQTDGKLLFVNAWNEWGEGMHLQGDSAYPTQRLDALKRVKDTV